MSNDIYQNESPIPFDDGVIDQLINTDESYNFENKRIIGKLASTLESIVAFANSDGGIIIIGLEDAKKAHGRDRIYGLQEKLENWDELRRLIRSRITEYQLLPLKIMEIGCTLRNGSKGSIAAIQIDKSPAIHSIVENGTWVRLKKGNKELTAQESNELMFARGAITAESQLVDVDFDLLETDYWQVYANKRNLTRPIDQAMYHIGLAKKDNGGNLRPTRAAVLLFAEEPAGLMASKAAVRIFHYQGIAIGTTPQTNLVKPPKTISGPLIKQIQEATDYIIEELAQAVHMSPLGFEIVPKYPLRVIREAITNAVIHRDYHLPSDIHARIFANRIEIESPGLLVGLVTTQNIRYIGTHSRNSLIVNNLREFPTPPNLDAGEGVRMMFGAMGRADLYPPLYFSKAQIQRDAVMVVLYNQNRPTAWEQVSRYVDKNGWIANKHVRRILRTDDTLKASKFLKEWVDKGLLVVANPEEGTKSRKYAKSDKLPLLSLLASLLSGKENQ